MDCVVKRRSFLDKNLGAKEGGKEKTGFAFPLISSHGPLRFVFSHSRFSFASMRNTKRMPGSVSEVSKLRLVFTSDEVAVGVVIRSVEDRRPYDLVQTAFRFRNVGTCIVIDLSFRFCFQLQQSGFH